MSNPTLATMERLAACYRTIAGVITAFEAPPSEPLDDSMLPAVMVAALGLVGMSRKTSAHIEMTRNFLARLYVYPVAESMDAPVPVDAASIGAMAYAEALPFFDRVHVYFAQQPKLGTASLNPLAFVQVTGVTDGGVVARVAPGGAQYWCIDFMHQIVLAVPTCAAIT